MALRSIQPRLTAQASEGPVKANCEWVYYESFGMKTLAAVVLGVKTIAYLTPKDVGTGHHLLPVPVAFSRAIAWRGAASTA